jgi:hypothetical protein
MADFFRDVQFVLHGEASSPELIRAIKQHSGVVATAGKTRKGGNVVHLVGEDEDADALELTGAVRAELLRETWVSKCVKAGKQVDKTAFLACADAAPPASPKAGQASAGASLSRASPAVSRASGVSGGGPGRSKGDKLQAWSPEELNILIDFARENSELGISGQKLWDIAFDRNILPGRSAQAMRECAKRKRAFIEEGGEVVPKRRSMSAAAAAAAQLERSLVPGVLESLAKASGQPLEHVGWAVYQCNGEFSKAQQVLFGQITVDDFHPWSDEEDRIIAKYARGIIAADEGGLTDSERFRRISLVHADLKDEAQEADRVRAFINARDFTEIARRAAFLVEP